MSEARRELAQRMRDAVLGTEGELDMATRAAFYARAEGLTRGAVPALDDDPTGLTALVEKVALHSYKVTDEDITSLLSRGVSEEMIYEAVASAAVGAGMVRLDYALAVLAAEAP